MTRVLVGFDGSPPSRRALEYARSRTGAEGELHLLTVIPPSVRKSSIASMMPAGVDVPAEFGQTFEENARRRLDEVLDELKRKGARAHAHVRPGDAAQALLALAKEIEAEEIVIGHKSYETGQALGPNANQIVRDAHVPVTVVP